MNVSYTEYIETELFHSFFLKVSYFYMKFGIIFERNNTQIDRKNNAICERRFKQCNFLDISYNTKFICVTDHFWFDLFLCM